MKESRSLVRKASILTLVAAAAGLAGCVAEVAPAPVAPVDYYEYPYTYYDGHIVYFVHGSWYYPYGNRWYYYRRVPPGLSRRSGELHYYHAPYGRGGGPPHRR
jgi:hypothetical protein